MSSSQRSWFDTDLSFSFDATGEVPATGQLCLIPQGNGPTVRNGARAQIKSIQLRAVVVLAPGAGAGSDGYELYVVHDKQANGAAAGVSDVFTGSNLSTAMLNLNNSHRFRVLKHWHIDFNASAGVVGALAPQVHQLDSFDRLDIPVTWSGATGALTEITSSNIFLMAGSSGLSDDVATLTGTARLRFDDD